ncbi:YciI family protein [Synechococcus sp. M16CYN]|uniref:YciI family protein n=1 Tax=Synechococcus sp. M16CYN TaxID=3103139 RepID=UPI00324398C1
MAWFIKTETFRPETIALTIEQRSSYLKAHRAWIAQQAACGRQIRSGFLVDSRRRPGGGGLLIFQASSYVDALDWVRQDPMILADLVTWQLQEWIPVSGDGWP